MNTVYFFDENLGFNQVLKPTLKEHGIEVDYECDFSNLLTKIINFQPTILFIDSKLITDKSVICDVFNENSSFFIPVVIVIKENDVKLNIKNYSNLICLSYKQIWENINTIKEAIIKSDSYKMKTELFPVTKFNEILSFLFKINFSIKNQGTIYLKDCIKYYITCRGRCACSMSEAYQVVACMHHTNVTNIERSIRVAIHTAWSGMKPETMASSLGLDSIFFKKQPSCREMIIFASEYFIDLAKERCLMRGLPILNLINDSIS